MKTLPKIYSFGNIFKGNTGLFTGGKFVQELGKRCLFVNDEETYEMPTEDTKDLELIGITPTCIAEMATERGESIQIVWIDKKIGITVAWNNEQKLEDARDNESLESFALRVARMRKYIQ